MATQGERHDDSAVDLGPVCGDLGIRIDRNGQWFYHGSPILRKEMVCLFASILSRGDDGRFWLTTPVESGTITVDDVPFLAVELYRHHCGRDQVISFRTNVDEMVTLDAAHPLILRDCRLTGELVPYIQVRDGLEARLTRSVYYELVDLGFDEDLDGEAVYGLWSAGTFFPLAEAA